MSYWITVEKDNIDVDGDELNVYLEQDDSGSRYAVLKIKDIKEILQND